MNFRIMGAVLLGAVFAGISPFFGKKAVDIHGNYTHYVITATVALVMALTFLCTNLANIKSITHPSLACAITSGLFGLTAFLLVSHAWQLTPEKELPVIMITFSSSAVINALIGNFVGARLSLHQWLGAMLALTGIVLVNWKK